MSTYEGSKPIVMIPALAVEQEPFVPGIELPIEAIEVHCASLGDPQELIDARSDLAETITSPMQPRNPDYPAAKERYLGQVMASLVPALGDQHDLESGTSLAETEIDTIAAIAAQRPNTEAVRVPSHASIVDTIGALRQHVLNTIDPDVSLTEELDYELGDQPEDYADLLQQEHARASWFTNTHTTPSTWGTAMALSNLVDCISVIPRKTETPDED